MFNGVKKVNDNFFCGKCNTNIIGFKQNKINYCQICGNPLTEEAIELNHEVEKNIKLSTASAIINLVKDPSTILKIQELTKRF